MSRSKRAQERESVALMHAIHCCTDPTGAQGECSGLRLRLRHRQGAWKDLRHQQQKPGGTYRQEEYNKTDCASFIHFAHRVCSYWSALPSGERMVKPLQGLLGNVQNALARSHNTPG